MVRNTCPTRETWLNTRALNTRIELGQRIVQQDDRGAADRLFDGGRFRETQCQRHQALLSPRSERAEVTSLQSDEEIVSVGTNERLAPADFLRKASAQALMKRRRRGHITQCRSILDSNAPTPPQGRIQAFSLSAQSHDALPAPGNNLHAEVDDLLIPRFETTLTSATTDLEEMIATRENLSVPPVGRRIRRIYLCDEPVQEVAARLRCPIDDGQISPSKRDHPRPRHILRPSMPRHRPREVQECAEAGVPSHCV